MVDSARTPQPQQSLPGAPIDIVGINGLGQLPTIQQPVAPTVGIDDRTAEFFQRSQQSVQNAFDYSQSVIETSARAAAVEAETTSRSNFGSAFSAIVGSISSGVQLFQEIDQQRKTQESQALAAELEQRVREQVIELHRSVGQNATDQGLIPTYTTMLRNLRQQYEGKIAPELLQQIINIGNTAITEVQQQQAQRWVNETEDLQANTRQLRLNELHALIVPEVVQLTHSNLSLNPSQAAEKINSSIASYLVDHNLSGMDALNLLNGIYPFVIEAYRTSGQDTSQFAQQQAIVGGVLQQAHQINQQFSGNAEMRNAAFAQLQLTLDQAGVAGVQLTDIFQTDVQRLSQQMELQRSMDALRQSQQFSPVLSERASLAMNALHASTALDWINNPQLRASELEIASSSEANRDQAAAFRIYESFQEDRAKLTELNRELASIEQGRVEALAQLESIADRVDPTGRLGAPTVTIDYIRRIVPLVGQERSELSRELSGRLADIENVVIANGQQRKVEIHNEIQNLHGNWFDVGINLSNPRDTSRMEGRLAEAQPIIQEELQRQSQQFLSPSNFQWGLPQLPQR